MGATRLLLCSCAGSQRIDPETARHAAGAAEVRSFTRLCEAEIDAAAEAFRADGTTLVACGQQAGLFAELAAEVGAAERVGAVDIRDRAGWTEGTAFAKQAALIAEATLVPPATPAKTVESDGVCLVLGGDAALAAAGRLADALAVTCILNETPDVLEPTDSFDIARGRVRTATGALGGFRVTVDGYAPLDPAGRGPAEFGPATNGAVSACDVILDLSGDAALFPAHHKREGYLRADPRDPAAVERTVFDAAQLVGEFEKPLYIRFSPELCAHKRAGQSGCTRCLSVCPTGAITSAGDTVAIDVDVCAGCGACAAVCPSGAAASDDPPVEFLFARLSKLAAAYRAAGGTSPRALFHAEHGAELVRLSARFGRGLPPDVIPVAVANVEGVGHAEILAALGVGFAEALVLAGPATDVAVPEAQVALARAIVGGVGGGADRVSLIFPADPDGLEEALWRAPAAPLDAKPILPLGGRREVTRLAATALAGAIPPPVALPPGAPYGAVVLDTEACTLCLACVSLCPVGALLDNPDKPQVRFQETACLQCGICATGCPEDAITLAPQLDLSPRAMDARVLNEEEPFCCVECGKAFGVKSTVDRIVEKLSGKHWMFTNSDNVRLIQMCDDCRIAAQYHQANSPFRMGERPRPRTTDDDLRDREKLN